MCLCLGEGGYATKQGGDRGRSSTEDGSSQLTSDTTLDSGDSLGTQEDREYLKNEETEAQRVERKGLSIVSVAAGLPYGLLVLCFL